jgi:hypothetical protein
MMIKVCNREVEASYGEAWMDSPDHLPWTATKALMVRDAYHDEEESRPVLPCSACLLTILLSPTFQRDVVVLL